MLATPVRCRYRGIRSRRHPRHNWATPRFAMAMTTSQKPAVDDPWFRRKRHWPGPTTRPSSPIRLPLAWQNNASNFPLRRRRLTPIRPGGPQQSDDSFPAAASPPKLHCRAGAGSRNLAPAPVDNDGGVQPIVLEIHLGSTQAVLSQSPMRPCSRATAPTGSARKSAIPGRHRRNIGQLRHWIA